jgi:hypothetical protein
VGLFLCEEQEDLEKFIFNIIYEMNIIEKKFNKRKQNDWFEVKDLN